MNASEINNVIRSILTHDSPVVFGSVSNDVKGYLDQLYSAGDIVVPHIVSAVTACATNGYSGGTYWWDGAKELCKLLSRFDSPTAKTALLTILKTNSRIVEFDGVRATAANQLSNFKDSQLVGELTECSKMPNAPVLEINKTIEALGGNASLSPAAIIAEGRNLEDTLEAIRYFIKHQSQVANWSDVQKQGGFYYFFGCRVEGRSGTKAAYPLFAAGLVANPEPNAAAWGKFQNQTPSLSNAQILSKKYPLTEEYLASLTTSSSQKVTKKKWWEFWK